MTAGRDRSLCRLASHALDDAEIWPLIGPEEYRASSEEVFRPLRADEIDQRGEITSEDLRAGSGPRKAVHHGVLDKALALNGDDLRLTCADLWCSPPLGPKSRPLGLLGEQDSGAGEAIEIDDVGLAEGAEPGHHLFTRARRAES